MDKVIFQADYFRATVTVWRRMNNFTLGELSELTAVSVTRLGAIEAGGNVPTIPELTHLCDIMKLAPQDFFSKPKGEK